MHYYMDSKARKAILKRMGHRGLFLFFLGLYDLFFGVYLLIGGSLHFPLAFTNPQWGWIWTGVGLFLLLGAFVKRDGIFFATAAFIKVAWALEYLRLAFTQDSTNWARSVYWLALTGIVLVAAAWPEPQVKIIAEDAVGRAESVRNGEDK